MWFDVLKSKLKIKLISYDTYKQTSWITYSSPVKERVKKISVAQYCTVQSMYKPENYGFTPFFVKHTLFLPSLQNVIVGQITADKLSHYDEQEGKYFEECKRLEREESSLN